ncbi:MAG TPA: DinB family protein [Streptosporangiaceae bacterium]
MTTDAFDAPVDFPSPTIPASSQREVFLRYLAYFRSRLVAKLREIPADQLRRSILPSGWTPIELLKHLQYVEMRWLEWGFEGRDVADPWGDGKDDRWYVGADETLDGLIAALASQGERSTAVIEAHHLADTGQPGDRWDGDDPPPLERILFHLLQEYARHVGHLDIVAELVTGSAGE